MVRPESSKDASGTKEKVGCWCFPSSRARFAIRSFRLIPAAIIAKKRDSGEHDAAEIRAMVEGFVSGEVADYQMAAWAMAIVCRGMTASETAELTEAMLASGSRLGRASDRPRVDKHSTGGLGDSPSIALAPLLACFDLDVPMLSGRGLGITGGTLDKLESFPGYRTDLTADEIATQLRAIGCVITGTTPDIAPADRRLYALRDVTGTVESIALITASIMSKKLAESLDALALDVKFGSAAFMPTIDQAQLLAESLTNTGRRAGVETSAILTAMQEPLGRMVGNACEVNEAMDLLRGATDNRLGQVTLHLGARLLMATRRANEFEDAIQRLKTSINSGQPLARLQGMVQRQGGKFSDRLPLAPAHCVLAPRAGIISAINGRLLGQAVIELGGGRKSLGQAIDPSVGLEMLVRIGDAVGRDQPLVNVFAHGNSRLAAAKNLIDRAIEVGQEEPTASPLILSIGC